MIGSRYGDPSGLVPGVVVVVHGWICRDRARDGAGPDRIFFESEVIGAKLQDFTVIF
jgi:hypothetical protein